MQDFEKSKKEHASAAQYDRGMFTRQNRKKIS
jgi:hypothetical protein